MGWVEVLVWVGAAVSCAVSVPQALKTFRADDPGAGVSLWTWVLLGANAVVWAVWAVASGAYQAGAPSLVNGPCAFFIVWRVLRDRNRADVGQISRQ